MAEKRFWYDFEDCTGAKIVDFEKDKEYSLETIGDFREIENLLNALHEQNQNLKFLNNKYVKENKSLRVIRNSLKGIKKHIDLLSEDGVI